MLPAASTGYEMFAFFERTPDLVCIADRKGFFRHVNQAVVEKLGYSKEYLYRHPISTFIHPDDRELTRRRRKDLLSGKALVNFENRYLTSRGEVLWLHWTSVYFPDKEVVFAIAKDITERKAAENEIREKYKEYKVRADHFKTSLEKEKKTLAIELHEELAQLASAVRMDIGWLHGKIQPAEGEVRDRLEHMLSVTEQLVHSIRQISYSISPGMLEDLGLNETLQWHCQELTLLHGLPCSFESNIDDEKLPLELQLDLYRICQEALSNVVEHAQARKVWVSLKEKEGQVQLNVTDDGRGFDQEEQPAGVGLAGMGHRAASANGRLEVRTEKGKGVSILVTVPLPPFG